MNLILRFKLFLDEFEQKNYYRFVAFVIGALILFFVLLLYLHSNRVSSLQKQIKNVNKERIKVRRYLEEHRLVEDQKDAVAKVLSEEKSSFKILEFGNNVLQQTGLQKKLLRPL